MGAGKGASEAGGVAHGEGGETPGEGVDTRGGEVPGAWGALGGETPRSSSADGVTGFWATLP